MILLQFQTILYPLNCEKISKQIEIPYHLTVLLSTPHDKILGSRIKLTG